MGVGEGREGEGTERENGGRCEASENMSTIERHAFVQLGTAKAQLFGGRWRGWIATAWPGIHALLWGRPLLHLCVLLAADSGDAVEDIGEDLTGWARVGMERAKEGLEGGKRRPRA
jgi:hypothetical protein